MKKPNFFIIGAPKCGTTSLASWLGSHPSVYMPKLKEPTFFNSDSNHRAVTSLKEYEALFSGADQRHIAVGEASVWYLRSSVAVPAIEVYSPNSKYIVMLRDPARMAVSLHAQKIVSGEEDILSFQEAWCAQGQRQQGNLVPRSCPEPEELLYGEVCKLGSQLQQLYERVPRDRVLVVFLDDLKTDPAGAYSDVLRFLGLPEHPSVAFHTHNARRQVLVPRLNRAVRSIALALRRLGIRRTGIGALLTELNSRRAMQTENGECLEALREHFSDDVRLLESLTGRTLDFRA